MPTNLDNIVTQAQQNFDRLIEMPRGADSGMSLLELERTVFEGVVNDLYSWADATDKPSKYVPIERAAWYLDGNLQSMRYDQYLANGWPISSGQDSVGRCAESRECYG